MNAPKLDRLSALLEGLAPVVTLLPDEGPAEHAAHANPGTRSSASPNGALCLHLLIRGEARCELAEQTLNLTAPALVVAKADALVHWGAGSFGEAHHVVAARADLMGPVADLFLQEFESPRVVAQAEGEPVLAQAMALMASELQAPRCGHPALLNRAGDILFIGLLRHLVAHPGLSGAGLFAGLADPRVARALVAMHQRPNWGWTLEHLAHEAGMSRTAFATTFRQVMQKTPGRYLAAVRLAMAQRAVDQGKGLKQAARVSGYRNVSALSRALSREFVAQKGV